MSRRRQARPSAPHVRHLLKRRVKFFCTGRSGARHGAHLLAEYTMRDAGRVDFDGFMQGEGKTRGWELRPDGTRVLPFEPCARCAEAEGRELPFDAVEDILLNMAAGRVLRWDLSTGSLLES